MLLGSAISACILVFFIKMFADEDVSFGTAFIACFVGSLVGAILTVIAGSPIESYFLYSVVAVAINSVVMGVAVQLICSTDLRTIVKIVLSYAGILVLMQIVSFYLQNKT